MAGVLAIAGIIAFAAWSGAIWNYSGEYHVASYKDKEIAQQAKIDAATEQQEKAAAAHATEIGVAFDKGKEQAQVVYKTVVERGTRVAQNVPAFQNPQCVQSPDSLALLNAARASLRSGALPAEAAATQQPIVDVPVPVVKQPSVAAPGARGAGHPKPTPK